MRELPQANHDRDISGFCTCSIVPVAATDCTSMRCFGLPEYNKTITDAIDQICPKPIPVPTTTSNLSPSTTTKTASTPSIPTSPPTTAPPSTTFDSPTQTDSTDPESTSTDCEDDGSTWRTRTRWHKTLVTSTTSTSPTSASATSVNCRGAYSGRISTATACAPTQVMVNSSPRPANWAGRIGLMLFCMFVYVNFSTLLG